MKSPSKRWKSLKLAVLESLCIAMRRRIDLLAIPYFAAAGFYLQGWFQVSVNGASIASSAHVIALLLSIFMVVVLAPTLLTMTLIVMQIQRRMMNL